MHDLAGLAPAINPSGYAYACPNAPIPFNLGLGHAGFGWMTPRGGSTPDEIANSESLLSDFFDEVLAQFKVGTGQLPVAGVLPGRRDDLPVRAGTAGDLRRTCGAERDSAGGGGAGPTGYRTSARSPIFVAHGRHDQMIAESTAHAARDYLENAGYSPSFHVYDMGHEISGEVIRDLVGWMNDVLPPLGTP